jgi:hypothetical protein
MPYSTALELEGAQPSSDTADTIRAQWKALGLEGKKCHEDFDLLTIPWLIANLRSSLDSLQNRELCNALHLAQVHNAFAAITDALRYRTSEAFRQAPLKDRSFAQECIVQIRPSREIRSKGPGALMRYFYERVAAAISREGDMAYQFTEGDIELRMMQSAHCLPDRYPILRTTLHQQQRFVKDVTFAKNVGEIFARFLEAAQWQRPNETEYDENMITQGTKGFSCDRNIAMFKGAINPWY